MRLRALGLQTAVALALAGTANADTYYYDALGRLIRVERTNGQTTTYTYDAADNRTVVATQNPPSPPPPPPAAIIVVPLLNYTIIKITP